MNTVKPLVYKISLNLAVSHLRRKKILTFLSLDKGAKEARVEGNHNPEQKEKIIILRKLINELPSKLKETILLTEFSDMSYDEIGKSLDIPAGTVGSRRNKAISIIREKFKIVYGE